MKSPKGNDIRERSPGRFEELVAGGATDRAVLRRAYGESYAPQRFSTSIAAAHDLLAKIQGDGKIARWEVSSTVTDGSFWCNLTLAGGEVFGGTGDTAALAICDAVLELCPEVAT